MNKTEFYSKNSYALYCSEIKTMLQLDQLTQEEAKKAMECYLNKAPVDKCCECMAKDKIK